MRAAVLMSLVALSGCGAPCPAEARYVETLVFQDSTGAALAPLRLEDLETGRRYECTQAGVDANPGAELGDCRAHRMVLIRTNTQPHIIRAEAVTGGKFTGGVTPEVIPPAEMTECAQPTLGEVVVVFN
ncbi:MAG: hypothetical protein DI536_18570 [Archangium gephyra]|uniref:Lipoprotein n=1 Tax=Archangium gephyra TaxID=48 RepID=A0A2W5VL68_9BACT|nr:MAG: hypothetical protein DI536_18570 [Archangium gephyra]